MPNSAVIIVVTVVFLISACASTNWNNRVGTYTYGNAVAELGQPSEKKVLDNGDIRAKWLVNSIPITWDPVGGGKPFIGTRIWFRVMTFSTGGVLKSSKVEIVDIDALGRRLK